MQISILKIFPCFFGVKNAYFWPIFSPFFRFFRPLRRNQPWKKKHGKISSMNICTTIFGYNYIFYGIILLGKNPIVQSLDFVNCWNALICIPYFSLNTINFAFTIISIISKSKVCRFFARFARGTLRISYISCKTIISMLKTQKIIIPTLRSQTFFARWIL